MSSIPLLPIGPLSGNEILWGAIAEANRVHRNHESPLSGRYIPHPLHLIMLHLQFGFRVTEVDDLHIMVADSQHDTVEDCPEETSFERIESLFGAEVRRIVQAVTHDSPNYDKREERERILRDDWKVQSVKIADVAANSLRIARAISVNGLGEVEGFLEKPILERTEMERDFLMRTLDGGRGNPPRARHLREFALTTIDALEAVARAA
jgi:hypothetical protein